MQDLPHHYLAGASATAQSTVEVTSPGLDPIETAGPPQFGGPDNLWSPETMLVASIANCFILTFRAVARASRIDWISLECSVDGTLEKVDRVTQFTDFQVKARLEVPAGTNEAKALKMLDKSERVCLITNSLKADSHLEAEVAVFDKG